MSVRATVPVDKQRQHEVMLPQLGRQVMQKVVYVCDIVESGISKSKQ